MFMAVRVALRQFSERIGNSWPGFDNTMDKISRRIDPVAVAVDTCSQSDQNASD